MPLIGVIGGSGVYDIPGLGNIEHREVDTPFGRPSAAYKLGVLSGVHTAFLPRHGLPHAIAPHKINYRANLWGFKSLGVERLISISAVGGINPAFKPGDIVLMEQVIDMTQGARSSTFYEDKEVVHIDFTEPYCPELKDCIIRSGKDAGIGIQKRPCTYVCTNGPRLESRAEIKFFSLIGGDVVGMTGMPEAALARELAMCFSGIAVITNHAAGISGQRLSATEVIRKMKEANDKVSALLAGLLPLIPKERTCPCKDSLKDARVGS